MTSTPGSCHARPVFASRAAVLSLVLLVCSSVGLGCLGRSPAVEHFMLGHAAPAATGTGGAAHLAALAEERAVLVGPVTLPAYLERPQIARLEAGGEVELDEFGRWLGGFEKNFLRAVSLGLARELGSVKVVTYPSSAPFPVEYRIRLHVDDLVWVGGEDALRIRIRWALIEEGGEVPTRLFLFEKQVPVVGASNLGVVSAHERVLSELAAEIAAELRR